MSVGKTAFFLSNDLTIKSFAICLFSIKVASDSLICPSTRIAAFAFIAYSKYSLEAIRLFSSFVEIICSIAVELIVVGIGTMLSICFVTTSSCFVIKVFSYTIPSFFFCKSPALFGLTAEISMFT